MANQQLTNDLMKHLTGKLKRLLSDIAHTCDIADIEPSRAIKMMMSCLLVEVIRGAACLELTETEFVRMCRIAYRGIYEQSLREVADDD